MSPSYSKNFVPSGDTSDDSVASSTGIYAWSSWIISDVSISSILSRSSCHRPQRVSPGHHRPTHSGKEAAIFVLRIIRSFSDNSRSTAGSIAIALSVRSLLRIYTRLRPPIARIVITAAWMILLSTSFTAHAPLPRLCVRRRENILGTILGTRFMYSRYCSPKILRNRRSSMNMPKRK